MTDVMDRLRTETRDLHQEAERQELQQQMVRGVMTRRDYVDWLRQMLLVHRALETRLADAVASDERFRAVTSRQFQVPYLEQDLAALGAAGERLAPLPATAAFVERVAQDATSEPLALLGYHYVLEGSNNGNRFIARRLLPTLGLDRDHGGRYLDPYGAEQPAIWGSFKRAMSEVSFSTEEIDALVAAARRMFSAISAISGELAGSDPLPAAADGSAS